MTHPAGERRPRVSVIIATFNRALVLRCALQSVLLQESDDFEVLVAGDRCTDDSSQVVAAFHDARVHWLNRDVNCGSQWGPNNDAVRRARGEYIAFLGHDDLWLQWHLTTLVALLDAGADLAHPTVALLAPEGVRGVSSAPPKGESYATTHVPPSGWVLRRSVLDLVGGFRDHRTISAGTDDDLLRRISQAGHRIAWAPRLSVLKFPSPWWRAYDAAAARPQEKWIAAITTDAHDVEREILTDAVAAMAFATPNAAPARAFTLAARAGGRWLRGLASRDGNVFGPIARAWFRRQTATAKRRRGL